MLPMTVEIGEGYQGCISSFDIVTTNADGRFVLEFSAVSCVARNVVCISTPLVYSLN